MLGQPTRSYTYDAADRLTQITQGAATVTLAYDPAGPGRACHCPTG
ncbi:MAG: hypothetical protein HYR50_17020 [Candidatus Rokubacteria bacterium]|nr:hypothetical protein [Candidatus Rokubacteria bacterium]